jgi:peptidoglycan/xylan/chitin deacetylase (PgdA/CDA1 family)
VIVQVGTWPLAGASGTAPLGLLPGAAGRRLVALTFDDGPGPYTRQVLDVLAAKHVHATFCQIGRQVGDFPAVERRIVEEGHALCNHSWDHDYAQTTAAATIPAEIDRTNAALVAACGTRPQVMRAPGGLWTAALYSALRARNMVPLGWAVDPDDWMMPGTAAIVGRVLAQVRPGAVILLHDGGGDRSQTVAALGTIIDTLRARGYDFVTL